ncbi:MAG: L,D-transpeptidase family protein, partial [Terriglobia bacterium]
AADERVVLYRDDRPVFLARVIVGQDERQNQTPEFSTVIDGVLFNPPWTVPEYIATEEILPKLGRDPNYLTRHHMVMLADGVLQQLPGAHSGLGQLKFEMANRFGVYLHDAPEKILFGRDDRRISHGCIRVQNVRELATLLLQEPKGAIDRAVATGATTRADLPAPMPVFVVYETAFADINGTLQFRPDIYNRDPEIWSYLHPPRQPLAEGEPPGQPRG